MSGRLIVVGGGVRSGKSAFALARARALGQRRRFIATAQPFDGEMRARIARHVEERGGEFETVEEPLSLLPLLAASTAEVVVIDCLTLWLSNLLLAERSEPAIEAEIDALAGAIARARAHVVVVTNEVGMGVVPESRLGRVFRDLAGRAHQRLCAQADEIYLGVLGCLLRLKPGPIELAPAADGGERAGAAE